MGDSADLFGRRGRRAVGAASAGGDITSAAAVSGDRGRALLFADAVAGGDGGARRVGMPLFAVLGGASVGFYDGFFGPGAGSFYALGYVMLLGLSLPQATAHAKVLNFTSNAASLLLFIIGGNVVWSVGLCMLVGQAIGARVGARMVLTRGQQLIRPMIVVMSLIMSIKLLYDNHGSEILAWAQRWL